jgi:putative FmdB family regulatory protein
VPTYEYGCRGCPHTFEAMQSIVADPLRDCPECKRPLLYRKVSSGTGVIFKGSGFYETDYKRKSKPPAKGGEGA